MLTPMDVNSRWLNDLNQSLVPGLKNDNVKYLLLIELS